MAKLIESTFKLIPMWPSRSIEETARFYREHIHAKIGPLYPSKENPRFVSVFWGTRAAANIYFTIYEPDQGKQFVTNQAMVAMGSDELEPWYEKLHADSRIKITEDIKDMPWGYRQFTITDPDGHSLTFFKILESEDSSQD
jgi:uncharacterized glyoxalase superfamily protein PhnB